MKKDLQGRQFVALHDVRAALVTASSSISTGTAVTFLAGDADYFLDLIEVSIANSSTVAATFTLTNDGTTIRTFTVPSGNTIRQSFDAPVKQNTKGIAWLADLEDITGTSLTIDAVFIKKL